MPWGDNKNKSGPWGKPSGGSGGGGGGHKPPEIEDIFKNASGKFREIFGGRGNGPGLAAVGVVVFVIWLISGFFIVDAKEQGVILRFGKFDRTVSPGLNYRLPFPVERHLIVPVTTINRVEVGLRSLGTGQRADQQVPEESLMLTGDENIVDIHFEVQWKVGDVRDYLFNVRDPMETVKSVAESSMREIIGRTPIAGALAEGKLTIQQKTKDLLQKTLNNYKAGIEIVALQLRKVDPPLAVIDAFRDVQTAKADQERARNEAETYRNDIIPRARGQAEQILQEADAYKQKVVAQAQGEASRFVSVYDKYKVAQDVTKRRIYLETMENILAGMDKVIIDSQTQKSGVLPYLPLPALEKNKQPQPASQ